MIVRHEEHNTSMKLSINDRSQKDDLNQFDEKRNFILDSFDDNLLLLLIQSKISLFVELI